MAHSIFGHGTGRSCRELLYAKAAQSRPHSHAHDTTKKGSCVYLRLYVPCTYEPLSPEAVASLQDPRPCSLTTAPTNAGPSKCSGQALEKLAMRQPDSGKVTREGLPCVAETEGLHGTVKSILPSVATPRTAACTKPA